MVDRVARSPDRRYRRDGKLCYYRRLEYDFLAFYLLPSFLYFSQSLSGYVSLLRVASTVQHFNFIIERY